MSQAALSCIFVVAVILADDSENSVDVDKPSHGPDGHFLKDRLRSHVTTHTGDKRKSGEGHRNGGHGHSNNHNHNHKGHGVGKFRVGDGEHKAMEEENHLLRSATDSKTIEKLSPPPSPPCSAPHDNINIKVLPRFSSFHVNF